MTLTIVLTVYNKELYLVRAMNSLISQVGVNQKDYEILAVNDGSTDGSQAIINDFLAKDSRIRVIEQKNQGLSVARNNGLYAAHGSYVWFVDADDIIAPNSVSLINAATADNPDVVSIYAQTEGESKVRNMIPETVKTGKDVLLSDKWEPCGVFNVFNRSFLVNNELKFISGIYHEDSEFTPRALYKAKKVKVVPDILYTVIHEPNSITQVPRAKRAFDYLVVSDRLNSFVIENEEVGSKVGQVIDNRISWSINNALSIIIKNSCENQRLFDTQLQTRPHLLRPLKSAKNKKYYIEACLFKLFPGHYCRIYKLMKMFSLR